jgi:hypothetical protein
MCVPSFTSSYNALKCKMFNNIRIKNICQCCTIKYNNNERVDTVWFKNEIWIKMVIKISNEADKSMFCCVG